jgi:hypothetical protein
MEEVSNTKLKVALALVGVAFYIFCFGKVFDFVIFGHSPLWIRLLVSFVVACVHYLVVASVIDSTEFTLSAYDPDNVNDIDN